MVKVFLGSLYTMTYLITMDLKRNGIHRPKQTERLRAILNGILTLATAVEVSHEHLLAAVNDGQFTDLEDSYQYHCALQNNCQQLVTINTRDYQLAYSPALEVLSPADFVSRYLP